VGQTNQIDSNPRLVGLHNEARVADEKCRLPHRSSPPTVFGTNTLRALPRDLVQVLSFVPCWTDQKLFAEAAYLEQSYDLIEQSAKYEPSVSLDRSFLSA
jgi:hypothetical protein